MSALPLRLITNDGGDPWIVEQKMFDILNDFLQPSSVLSPTAAAKQLDRLFPLNRTDSDGERKEEPESFLWELWSVIIKVAQQIPWKSRAQDRLAELIKALRDLPSEIVVEIWSSKSRIWQDLPLLGPSLTETMRTFDLDALPTAEGAEVKTRQCWQSYNAFEARLTRDDILDCQYSAIMVLREALEEEPDARARAYHRQGPILDCHVPVAAEWIFRCGHVLYTSHKSFGAASKGGRLWKGAEGFSPERWQFWKQRFIAISEHDQVKEETKIVAREAERMMATIE